MGLLLAAGLFAGALNAIAGGATFFTFPALMLTGLPPLVANATNFVALAPSNIAALPAFRAELRRIGRALIPLLAVGGLGGLLGALALLWLGAGLFASAVPWLMATATLLFAGAPHLRKWFQARSRGWAGSGSAPTLVLLFVFSVYGGYFGAGLGQIILAALIISGHGDFHAANALKNAVIAAISLTSVAIYALSGVVAWPEAGIMLTGATLGGFFGGRYSRLVPQLILRRLVITFGLFLTTYYFFFGT